MVPAAETRPLPNRMMHDPPANPRGPSVVRSTRAPLVVRSMAAGFGFGHRCDGGRDTG